MSNRRTKRSKRSNRNSRTTVAVTVAAKKKASAPRNRRNRRGQPTSISPAAAALSCYLKTLRDPWQYAGCRIGFGTMVSTNLTTAYYRAVINGNADGTCAFALFPSLINMINYSIAGAAVATWGANNASNTSALQTANYEYRVVSGGLRCLPQVAGTAAPGLAYVGSLPAVNTNQLTATTINTMINNPAFHIGYAAPGASALVMPIDPASFQFTASIQGGYAGGIDAASSVPVIIFTGLPATCPVLVEGVLNLEGTVGLLSSGSTSTPGEAAESDSLADHFPSLDAMWAAAKRLVPDPTSVSEGFAAASGMLVNGARLAHTVQRVRGQIFPRIPASNRLLIEELD